MDNLSLKALVSSANGPLNKEISFFCGFNNYFDNFDNMLKPIPSAMFVTKDDQVYSVGYNNEANLLAVPGNGVENKLFLLPELIQRLSGVGIRKIIIMDKFGVALTAHGKLIYWGIDLMNVGIGIRTKNDVKLPYQPKPDMKVDLMACSANFVVVRTEDNKVLVWGYLGDQAQMSDFIEVQIGTKVVTRKISCGWNHVALLDSKGNVWTFGHGSVGQLGYMWHCEEGYETPKKVTLPGSCQVVECGFLSTVYLMKSGEVYASGRNERSDYLCVGRTGVVYVPAKVLLNDTITHIAAAFSRTSRGSSSIFSAYSKASKVHYRWGDDPESQTPDMVKEAAESLDIFDYFRTPQSLSEIKTEMKPPIISRRVQEAQPKPNDTNIYDRSILIKWEAFDNMPEDLTKRVESFKILPIYSGKKLRTGGFIITYDDEVYFFGDIESFESLVEDEEIYKRGEMDSIKVEVLCNKNISTILVGNKRGVALSRNGQLYEWSVESPLRLVVTRNDEKVQQVIAPPAIIYPYYYLTNSNKLYFKLLNDPEIPSETESVREIELPEKIVKMTYGFLHSALLTVNSSVYTHSFKDIREYNFLGYDWKLKEPGMVAKKVELPGPCKEVVCGALSTVFLMETGEVYASGFLAGVDRNSVVPLKVEFNEPLMDVTVFWIGYKGELWSHFIGVGDSGVVYSWGKPDEEKPVAFKWVSSTIDLLENQYTPQIHLRPINSQDGGETKLSNTLRKPRQDPASSLQRSVLHDSSIFEKWMIFDNVKEEFANRVVSFKVDKDITGRETYAFMITYDDEVYFLGGSNSFEYLIPSEPLNTQNNMRPRKVDVLCKKNIVTIISSKYVGIALSRDGVLYKWTHTQPLTRLKIRDGGKVQQVVADPFLLSYSFLTDKNNVYYNDGLSYKMYHLSEKIVAMSAGISHFALLTEDLSVYTYSLNDSVKFNPNGLGYDWKTRVSDDIPKKVELPGPCKKVVSGAGCSIFLMGNGEVYACGAASGVDPDIAVPQKVMFDEQISDIDVVWVIDSPRASFNVAATHSGVIYSWGFEYRDKPEVVKGVSSLIDMYEDRTSPQIHLISTDEKKDHQPRLNNESCTLFGDPLYSDVTIKLSDGLLPAHRLILHNKSRKFRNMLSSRKTTELGEIDLRSYNLKGTRLYLESLYGRRGVKYESLEDLLQHYALAKSDGNLDLVYKRYITALIFAEYLKRFRTQA